jgi:transposase
VARAARLAAVFTAANVSAGFAAGVRGKAASRLDRSWTGSGRCCARPRVPYADETPARADGRLRYVHVARTEFLTALHTGGRSATAIDAGEVLP